MSARRESLPPFNTPSIIDWLALLAGIAIVAFTFHASVIRLSDAWFEREEYSHGILIPFIAAFLIWQRWPKLATFELNGSWLGFALVVAGLMLKSVGDIGTFYILQQYALLLVLYGCVLALLGWRAFQLLLVPLLMLFFMIPLPEFVLQKFSTQLQLLSSQLGVLVIRAFGISVSVEGNVIDLGTYKLQVAEACNGLRYLFPLMTLGFIMAYFFKTTPWKRVVLFVSSVPITVFMNSLRIGVIGVMVEYWGIAMAEGFLHEFQGWLVFMLSTAIMVGEMWLLTRMGRDRRPWREVFGLEMPASRGLALRLPEVSKPFVIGIAVLGFCAVASSMLPVRSHPALMREPFSLFPDRIGSWNARREALDQVYLDALKLDDYIVANYQRNEDDLINLYIAWYSAQQAGEAAHSPRACLPAGGWTISDLRQIEVPGIHVAGKTWHVNRVVIQANDSRQVVYYWFQQRGRVITNEYMVKWYLFWDSLLKSRTDGAMVRLVAPWRLGEDAEVVDQRLQQFAADMVPRLDRYVPN